MMKEQNVPYLYHAVYCIFLLYTLTILFHMPGDKENLDIGSKVSSALVEIVSRIKTRPRYLLAKVLSQLLEGIR
jgi:hypothetical protein